MRILEENDSEKSKTPAANERFGASGGADSSDTEQVTSSVALVQTAPIPPPAAKPPPRYRQCRAVTICTVFTDKK